MIDFIKNFFAQVAFFVVVGNFSVFAQELPDLGEASRAVLSPQIERRIGESIMNEIRLREPSYVDDPEINDYLAQLGGRLVQASANPSGNFHFFAIRDNAVNAFAMYGGFIGVNTGTLLISQSESELASVMSHEIAHVTQSHLARQMAKEKQNTIPSLIALAVGILAARANSSVAAATIASTQAGLVQSQLSYSRDFEREADRAGYQTLEKAGFDVRGMGDFFERLQKASHLYEISAPTYLRSHPLTSERISDMQNRAESSPYYQVTSSLEFYLVRAKLKAQLGTPQDAVKEFETQLQERKYASQAAARYGLIAGLLRAKDIKAAQHEMEALRALKVASPMIVNLEGAISIATNNLDNAVLIYREALLRFPQAKSLVYGYADALFLARQYPLALKFLDAQLQRDPSDYKLYGMQAKIYAAQGKRLQEHRAQAELYAWQGQTVPAIEQLNFAQQLKEGDFYEQSRIDARLRELKQRRLDEERFRKEGL